MVHNVLKIKISFFILAARASDPSKGVYGAGAHSDYGLITLLATDDVVGLQVSDIRKRRKGFKKGKSIDLCHCFILNNYYLVLTDMQRQKCCTSSLGICCTPKTVSSMTCYVF
jgi:2OG-Fe(II) oxygenase superfamily